MKKIEKEIYSVLHNTFGADEFRPSQKEAILRILEGKHSMILMPTGMGKSLCYQLPALFFDGLTVVISPLIALMKDQTDRLKELSIDASFVNSSLNKQERENRYNNIKNGKYKILYVSPERFRKQAFLDVIQHRKISLLALDEAHCVSQWGNDFRPDYSRIGEFRKIIGEPVTIALTATATANVQQDIIDKIGIPLNSIKIFNEGICRPNLFLEVFQVIDEEEKFNLIFEKIKQNDGVMIIYFNLIKSIERLSEWLDLKKTRYTIYHGKLSPEKRKKIQSNFMNAQKSVMLATNAFGMGIDKPDIRTIIHAEIPDSIESYYQEIGRGGRDGKKTECILFYDQNDLAVQISFLEWRNPDAVFIKNVYTLLKSLGENVNSFDYDDLQAKVVHKQRDDHRLQTVFNLFDMHGVTKGSIENKNLRLMAEIPNELQEGEFIKLKMNSDRLRLIDMMNYSKSDECRRKIIYRYFGIEYKGCGNCDNCL